ASYALPLLRIPRLARRARWGTAARARKRGELDRLVHLARIGEVLAHLDGPLLAMLGPHHRHGGAADPLLQDVLDEAELVGHPVGRRGRAHSAHRRRRRRAAAAARAAAERAAQ